MQLKKLRQTQETLAWPSDSNDLPVVSWETCTLIFSFISVFEEIESQLDSPRAVPETSPCPHLWIYS